MDSREEDSMVQFLPGQPSELVSSNGWIIGICTTKYAGHTHFKREGEKTIEKRDCDLVQQMYDSIENLPF